MIVAPEALNRVVAHLREPCTGGNMNLLLSFTGWAFHRHHDKTLVGHRRLLRAGGFHHGLGAAYRVSTSESCPALTVPTSPPGNEPEAFSSLAFFLPAAIAALCVAKPFPVSATALFESRIS